jgi:threonine/homoserine/homoserine lactone efflux protein
MQILMQAVGAAVLLYVAWRGIEAIFASGRKSTKTENTQEIENATEHHD